MLEIVNNQHKMQTPHFNARINCWYVGTTKSILWSMMEDCWKKLLLDFSIVFFFFLWCPRSRLWPLGHKHEHNESCSNVHGHVLKIFCIWTKEYLIHITLWTMAYGRSQRPSVHKYNLWVGTRTSLLLIVVFLTFVNFKVPK